MDEQIQLWTHWTRVFGTAVYARGQKLGSSGFWSSLFCPVDVKLGHCLGPLAATWILLVPGCFAGLWVAIGQILYHANDYSETRIRPVTSMIQECQLEIVWSCYLIFPVRCLLLCSLHWGSGWVDGLYWLAICPPDEEVSCRHEDWLGLWSMSHLGGPGNILKNCV